MGNNLFILTEKDFVKLFLLLLLSSILFGLSGIVMMIILQWISRGSYAKDSVDKHGISPVVGSRMGGAAVAVFTAGLFVLGAYNGLVDAKGPPLGLQLFGWLAVIACLGLGLVEDLRNDELAPRFRLCIELVIFAVLLAFRPELIPVELGIWGLDTLMALPIMGWLLTVVFCVGFINAVNMSDGANGLIPGICTISFGLFYAETGAFIYACLMTSCGLFTLFNMISGRLFLGDAGSYGLGAALGLSGLFLYCQDILSAPFLAVLLAYPCIDFMVTMVRRASKGRSIFLPDNGHLHNSIYFYFQKRFPSTTLPNSLTGGTIVMASSGVALVGSLSGKLPATSQLWIIVFATQCLVYGLVFYLTGLDRPASEYVAEV